MKFKICGILLLLILKNGYCQNWQSVGGGTDAWVRGLYLDTAENELYAVGNFQYAGDTLVYQAAVWDGSNWNKMGNGTGDTNCLFGCNPIFTITKFGTDVYVSGQHVIMGGVYGNKYFSKWNSSLWQTCGNPNNGANACVTNDTLFAVGFFDTINNLPIKNIAKWNGTGWESFGAPVPFINSDMPLCIQYYNNEYYVAGNFEPTSTLKEIIKWDGTQWQPLLNGIPGNSYVKDMVVFNNLLYVSGVFHQSDGNVGESLMAWNGTEWINPLPPEVFYFNGIEDLEIIDNKLYIAGQFFLLNDSSMFGLAHFDGVNFCAFGGRANFPDIADSPYAIAGNNGTIYVACNAVFWNDTVNYIAEWTGGNDTDTCIAISTGINSLLQARQHLNIYPTPAVSTLTIQLSEATKETLNIEIKNMLGQTLQSLQLQAGNKQLDINVSLLAKGIYFVQCQSKDVMISKKFVKQ